MNKPTYTTRLNVKRVAILCLLAIVFVTCLTCASCEYINPALVRIDAFYNGYEVEVGSTLNKDDVLVIAHFSDKTKKVVTDFVLNYDFSTAGQRRVDVSYGYHGKVETNWFYVAVVEKFVEPEPPSPPNPPIPPAPVVTLKDITAIYNGENIQVDGTLNNADIVVTAYYSDDINKLVSSFTVNGFSSAAAGEKTVTVTYAEGDITKTCTVVVTVVEPEPPKPIVTLESITAVYNGPSIKVGGNLNNDNIVVTAYYSDESSKAVANFAVSGFNSATAGTCVITVSYAEDDITKEVKLNVTIAENNVVEVADYGKYGILQDDGSVKITNTAVVNDNLQIHFLAFENVTPGDCVYIKAGDTDILIDAGSVNSSSTTIDNYIKKYCTDGVLEYVIATHADSDHISGFVGTSKQPGILDKYKCQTIIRYTASNKTTNVKNDFEAKCQQQVDNNNAKLYTALQCYNQTDGAQRVYRVSDNVEMEVLYHKYYNTLSSDENNQSVCVIFHQYGNGYDFKNPSNPDNKNYVNHFLFTGDLEEEGEASLVANNPNLPEVVLFKGGHHGSATSSTEGLLNLIKPKLVCVCTCCDLTTTYKFPRQEFLNRVAKHTDMVFMTNTRKSNGDYAHLNGNIAVTSNGNGVFVNCSNNNTLFKDTDWFKNNRDYPPEWEPTTN